MSVLKGSNTEFTIEPDVISRETLSIEVKADKGTATINSSGPFYENDEFSINWKEDSSYAFLGWTVINANTNEQITNYSNLL